MLSANLALSARVARRLVGMVCLVLVAWPSPHLAAEELLSWHSDYGVAARQAQAYGKMLLIHFHDPAEPEVREVFQHRVLEDSRIQELLSPYVRLELSVDATTVSDGNEIKLLDHPSFTEMRGRPGVAVIDYAHAGADYYGHVVSTFPFQPGRYYDVDRLAVVLELPDGTLTQRTMIFAVRIHPETPHSTEGDFHPELADEASAHSQYQAQIRNQGHHNWGTRFSRIVHRLQAGSAQEVVAESWAGESLVDACVECVRSWRQSPGHWGAVRGRHPSFAYDIKRGSNGVWYATGLFANARHRR